jgi:MoxR-like ATPase
MAATFPAMNKRQLPDLAARESQDSLGSIDALQGALLRHSYIADRGLATSIYLAIKLKRPLFLEGEAGVGKTEVAKVLAHILGAELIRLQCYEGLDINQAVYEWNYSRQMLHIRLMESRGEKMADEDLFGPAYLLRRPLLQAISNNRQSPPVLLIDEIDRSDEEFEAYLLELLSDYQITIPEIGTLRAEHPPVVVITSNRTREIHDGLKRRCLYQWIDYPSFDKELDIVRTKAPEAPEELSRQVTAFVQELRRMELFKSPGVAETLDWVQALTAMDQQKLTRETVRDTLGVILKYQDDIEKLSGASIDSILARIGLG